MATRTITACDLCDAEPAETVVLSAHGVSYEIDLCESHSDELDGALAPFTAAARVTAGARRRPTKRTPTARKRSTPGRTDLALVREWAGSNGYDVKTKGRIRPDVLAAYDASANGGAPARRKRRR